MSAAIYDYVRNIAVFLIFMGFAGIITPDGKFKGYVNLAMRLILVLLVARPLISFIGGGLEGTLSEMGLRLDTAAIRGEYSADAPSQNAMIIESYKNSLEIQLRRLLEPYKDYSLEECIFIVGENGDNFGVIEFIDITLNTSLEKTGFIRIEPIIANRPMLPDGDPEADPDEEPEEIKNMKKAVSDFYNVTSNNIYIIVQRTE